MLVRSLTIAALLLVGVASALGLVFAGSPAKLADGVHIAGVDVSGMAPAEAQALLEGRTARLASVPVTFMADGREFRITAKRLGVEVDWAGAVDAARRQGEGFGPVRGFRRLQVRFFGADVSPPVQVYDAGLRYEVGRLAKAIGSQPRDAALVLRGLRPVVVPARTGLELDRAAAEPAIVRALAGFARVPVSLPVRREPSAVAAAELRTAAAQARVALSAPVHLTFGETRWRLPRWRIAELLSLPQAGGAGLEIGGRGAERWFERLAENVNRPAEDAGFAVDGTRVSVVPARDGYAIDVPVTSKRLLDAALSTTTRAAPLAIATTKPARTTADAQAMGITDQLAAYETPYAGTADRIHNLQLAISLLDGALVPPGGILSLNERVGPRTEERGFRSAPVIVNAEYEEGIGGGVSQVATTVFNAAWEAGLPIVERNPHALYIARYPLGRDATLNYPDLDLRFRNDTERWILVRGYSGAAGIVVALYGAPTGRRVESVPGELVVRGAVPLKRVPDPALKKGTSVVEEEGAPPTGVRVQRVVYDAEGAVLRRENWETTYRGEKRVIRVGTKPLPKPKPLPKDAKGKDKGKPATTAPTETGPAATTPTTTEPAAEAPPPAEPGVTDPVSPPAG